MAGISLARELTNCFVDLHTIDAAEDIAWKKPYDGLTDDEYETLENLCHKLARSIEDYTQKQLKL